MYYKILLGKILGEARARCTPSKSALVHVTQSRVTLYTAGHLHTAVPHCSHSRAPIVHTAVLRENNEHGCVYLRCRAVCKLPGCVEGHPWQSTVAKLSDEVAQGYLGITWLPDYFYPAHSFYRALLISMMCFLWS